MRNFAAEKKKTGVNRYILWVLSLLWVALPLSAQQVITGTVIDDETGEGIAYASVVCDGKKATAVADPKGRYSIARRNGTITFSAVGYKKRSMKVNAGTASRLDVKLRPDKRMLSEVKVGSKVP